MKVHVTLDLELLGSPELRRKVTDRIVVESGMKAVNVRRAERYGVVSGLVEPNVLRVIKAIPGVKSCELDEERKALG